MKDDSIAKFFYEQCAGTTHGHIEMVPNNPVLFTLTKASAGSKNDNFYAATQTDFAQMLRDMADQLAPIQ